MQYRIKDLLVTVLPGYVPDLDKRCLLHTRICTAPTLCVDGSLEGGMRPPTDCPHTTAPMRLCAPVSGDPWIINDKEDLAVLRAELKETLERLDQLETELPPGLPTKAKANEVIEDLRTVIRKIDETAQGLEQTKGTATE